MELKISDCQMFVVFNEDEGILDGMTVNFYGEWCQGNVFGVSTWSGKIETPVERKLTEEETEYVKRSVLEYCETPKTIRKVKFS